MTQLPLEEDHDYGDWQPRYTCRVCSYGSDDPESVDMHEMSHEEEDEQ